MGIETPSLGHSGRPEYIQRERSQANVARNVSGDLWRAVSSHAGGGGGGGHLPKCRTPQSTRAPYDPILAISAPLPAFLGSKPSRNDVIRNNFPQWGFHWKAFYLFKHIIFLSDRRTRLGNGKTIP